MTTSELKQPSPDGQQVLLRRKQRRDPQGHLAGVSLSAPSSGGLGGKLAGLCAAGFEQLQGEFEPVSSPQPATGIDLYWLPLGAGGHCVRLNGRVFEAVVSRLEHRAPRDLYHSALEVRVPEGRFVIEQAPVPAGDAAWRGVAAGGAVGARWAGRFRIFRYEVRCWLDGVIPDVGEAVDSPRRLTDDPACARRLLELVPSLPTPVWGRDELAAGEMWNSNSVTSWLIARSGLDTNSIQPPDRGRAPGWNAGLVAARRQQAQPDPGDLTSER